MTGFTARLVDALPLSTRFRLCVLRGCPVSTAMAESPFASSGCYPDERRVYRAFGQRYPTLVAPTGSCARPRLSDPLCLRSSCQSLQVVTSPCCDEALPDVISACLSLDAWTPTPAACQVRMPITSPTPSAFPQSLWVGSPRNSAQRLPSGGDFGAAVIRSCSGLEVCCHPGRSYRSVIPHGAAMAFTSEQNTGRYLPVHRIC
jgi:hypothetical protein